MAGFTLNRGLSGSRAHTPAAQQDVGCMTDAQRVLQRAGEAGQWQPDVGTAELPGPPWILR